MPSIDVNSLFARAEQAFLAGRLDEARRSLESVGRAAGDQPAALHLLALIEKRSGNREASRRAFERAASLAPADPRIAGNFANLLRELGDSEQALAWYDRALAADPGFRDARYNRALLLQGLGRTAEALAELDRLQAMGPAEARIHAARGAALKQLHRGDEAANAFDAALRLDPDRAVALHGRARLAMERGEPGASALYARALDRRPEDLELVLGLAEALEAEGEPGGPEILGEAVRRNPYWIVGHEALARMRSEAGEADRFADHYQASLARRPDDRALHLSYWRSLYRGQKHAEALAALREARPGLGDDYETRLLEAVLVGDLGDPRAALRLLDGSEDANAPDFMLARGRFALQAGDATAAADLLERATRARPESIAAWAHLDLAWRLTGDPRHDWLSGQAGLVGVSDIGFGAAELECLAELLRTLHRTRAHPIGQSLRGGTQTRGRLFERREPEIARLHEAIAAVVRDHFAGLPPRDDAHPLLRYRGKVPEIAGSWSVRLASQGFHVSHIHPQGVLSSACYISLPATIGSDDSGDGWLELGRPPAELGLPLEPLATIEPRPGRLALFPSYLFHGTRPFAEGERLTVAFDVVAP